MTPPSNTGVNGTAGRSEDERLVLEGGKVKVVCAERQQAKPSGVVVDYLRCTVRKDALLASEGVAVSSDDVLVQCLAFKVAGLLGFELGEERKGRDYYDFTWTINSSLGKEVGSVSGGGATQRDTFCITLKGEACSFAANGWEKRLHEFLSPMEPRITRIDMARDFLNGEVSIEEVVGCYECGEFDYMNRRPSFSTYGSWRVDGMAANVLGHSRTFQVGKRESGKLLRAYEKGHQFRMLNDAWVRVEVELRNVNRVIPFDAVIRPADFFAGAYPFCQLILDEKPVPQRVATGKEVGDRTVARFMRNFENQSIPSIVVMVQTLGPDQAVELLEAAVLRHAQRPTPRSLRGMTHERCEAGFREWFNKYSSVVPAGDAPF